MRELLKDRNRLLHIVDAIDIIIERCNGMTRDDLTADKLLFGGVVYHTMIIGEAVYNLTKAFCKAHPETPWQMIAKMRHNLTHVVSLHERFLFFLASYHQQLCLCPVSILCRHRVPGRTHTGRWPSIGSDCEKNCPLPRSKRGGTLIALGSAVLLRKELL